jgi:hypothetical protein
VSLDNPILAVGFATWVALAIPPAVESRSWIRLFISALFTMVGMLLPLFVFFFSAFLTPEWKGGCAHGWIDCFNVGKLALSPLVFWAVLAFYVVEVWRVTKPTSRWIVLGFFSGAIVSVSCLAYGLAFLTNETGKLVGWLLVPFYVSVWYSARAIQLMITAGYSPAIYLKTLAGSIPCWLGSFYWSRCAYQALPTQPPSCFIVTASMRGHGRIVGPFTELKRGKRLLTANKQLLIFWQFEAILQARAPRSHRYLRRIYNRIGPAVARRLISPWLADAVHISLLPLQLLAEIVISVSLARQQLCSHRNLNNRSKSL